MKLFFKSEEEIKTFSTKCKLREFVAVRLALQELLKVLLSEDVLETQIYKQKEWHQRRNK